MSLLGATPFDTNFMLGKIIFLTASLPRNSRHINYHQAVIMQQRNIISINHTSGEGVGEWWSAYQYLVVMTEIKFKHKIKCKQVYAVKWSNG